ncbi:MAG: queuine tRNA-ribosyltransferase [Myxococcota bacterium]
MDTDSTRTETRCCSFELVAESGHARRGVLHLTHGAVPTPAFMPVGTRGTVRGLTSGDLVDAGASIVLANTYHLWVRPGPEVMTELGGLHKFMDWSGPILTDSGGYQVFSMRDRNKVTEEGVRFRSPEDGEYRSLTPELAIQLQEAFGVDIAMAFDECIEWPASHDRVARSTERTTRWLRRCLAARRHTDRTAVFGIVQGGMFEDLRRSHAQELVEMCLDGYAIGGLSVGEERADLLAMAELTARELPRGSVRYLMGVGHPVDIADAVLRGIDLFDCVMPTRAGRHGHAYTSIGRRNLRTGRYRRDTQPLDPGCSCIACTRYSRGYLHHLIKCKELLGKRLVTLHNLSHYQRLMSDLREAISSGSQDRIGAVRAGAARASAPA